MRIHDNVSFPPVVREGRMGKTMGIKGRCRIWRGLGLLLLETRWTACVCIIKWSPGFA